MVQMLVIGLLLIVLVTSHYCGRYQRATLCVARAHAKGVPIALRPALVPGVQSMLTPRWLWFGMFFSRGTDFAASLVIGVLITWWLGGLLFLYFFFLAAVSHNIFPWPSASTMYRIMRGELLRRKGNMGDEDVLLDNLLELVDYLREENLTPTGL